jgi:hypothetical protein
MGVNSAIKGLILIYMYVSTYLFNIAHLVDAVNWVHCSDYALKFKPTTSLYEAGVLPVSLFHDIWFALQIRN